MVRTSGPNQMVNRMQGPGKDSQETLFCDIYLKICDFTLCNVAWF